MTQEIKLPDPDTHCWDDEAKSLRDVWSYSPELVRQIIEADRAQRGEPVAWIWRFSDGELHETPFGTLVECERDAIGYAGSAIPLYTALAAKPEQDRAQRGEPVLWRYRDSEQVIRAMDGYTPGEGWTPLYTATQPAHTEAEVQEILDSSLREWGVFEQTVRSILNVEKP